MRSGPSSVKRLQKPIQKPIYYNFFANQYHPVSTTLVSVINVDYRDLI